MNGRANCRQSSLGSSTILCRAPLRLPRSRNGRVTAATACPCTLLRDWKTSVLLAKSEIFPVLRFTLGQPLNRSFQSPPTRFVALRISDPVHVFLFVTVTEIFKRLSRFRVFLQRHIQIGRNANLLFHAQSRARSLNAGFV